MQSPAVLQVAARVLAYAATLAFVFEGLVMLVGRGGARAIMRDDGPVEWLQLAVAVLVALLFARLGRPGRMRAELMRVCSALALVAAARELDNLTLEYGSRDAYKYLGLAPALWALSVVARARGRIAAQLAAFASTPAFALLAAGFVVVVVYAQLVGQKALWMAVLPVDVYRPVKEVVEESSELLGYLLLLFGAVEATAARDDR